MLKRDIEVKLRDLEFRHRELDSLIACLQFENPVDILRLQRLKRERLCLRDEIEKLRIAIVPDIIA